MKEAPLLIDVLHVLQHGLLELRKIAADPERGEQRRALVDALHNLPAYVEGRLRGPGRPPKQVRLGVAGSRALHDEFLLGESVERLHRYRLTYPDCMFDYEGMLSEHLETKAHRAQIAPMDATGSAPDPGTDVGQATAAP